LRTTQQLATTLARSYVREDHVLDEDVRCSADPAPAEVQLPLKAPPTSRN
jgi:hypothetical protein